MPKRPITVLNGYGRIGRCVLRALQRAVLERS
jgi:glyceraldehyde-3-phosphate dehydrogenase/erythrose-4-phosphate dehydrogenase